MMDRLGFTVLIAWERARGVASDLVPWLFWASIVLSPLTCAFCLGRATA